MKNTILSPIPIKNIVIIFFAGLIGAWIFGMLFAIIGAIFAKYTGFNLAGVEDIGSEWAAMFFGIISTPIGAFLFIWAALKILGYKSKRLYPFLAALSLGVITVFFGSHFDNYIFLLSVAISSLIITTVNIFSIEPWE